MKKSTLFLGLAAMMALPMSAEVVYTFDTPASFKNWGETIEISEKPFANAKEGSVIKINFEIATEEVTEESPAQVQIALKTVADWTWTEIVKCAPIEGTSYSYTILDACPDGCDDTDLEMILAHGINLKGQHASVVSIELLDGQGGGDEPVNPDQPDQPDQPGEAWTSVWKAGANPTPFGSWTGLVEIPETAFADAVEGTVIKIAFTGTEDATAEAPSQVQLAVKTTADWVWTEIVKSAEIINNEYKYEITDGVIGTTDETDLEMLKAHGLSLKGQNATPVEIFLSSKSGAAVENIADDAIDFNAPVEIYSIDGRRVKEAANGLFIFRQGNKAHKVLVK